MPTWNPIPYLDTLPTVQSVAKQGKVMQVIGLTVESLGPHATIGEICLIYPNDFSTPVEAEVVGFRENRLMLMPFGDLSRIGPGSLVVATHRSLEIPVGQGLLGSIVDGFGRPLDSTKLVAGLVPVKTDRSPPPPLSRPRIHEPLELGVKAIDGLLTVGKGQRIGLFAGSGVGKSTLLGMIARQTEADIVVIGLIGERGREVREFIERDLSPEMRQKSVVVAVTSDQSPLQRIKGASTATTIAEYFRDQGHQVLLLMDSVTRFAMAQRELGLAIGEPPTTKGYTPSVFTKLPQLLERSGTASKGAITAIYTVLVDGDDFNEPIADAVRGILDGHIVLSRQIAQKGLFPAIDVSASVSRLMDELVLPAHRHSARRLKRLLATYQQAEDLLAIGAYKPGGQPELDEAVQLYPAIRQFLVQERDAPAPFDETRETLIREFGGNAS